MAILVFSPNGTHVVKPTLEAARTSADCTGKTVVVTSALTAAQSDITAAWPTNRTLEVKTGGVINNTAAFIVTGSLTMSDGTFGTGSTGAITINGKFSAGLYKVFAGTGAVTFGVASAKIIYPEWWGAVGDDTTDSTAAVQIAATAAGTAKILELTGMYSVTSTLGNFALTISCRIKGISPSVSGIHNTGTGSAILINGANYYSRWENFSVVGNVNSQHGIVTSISPYAGQETAYCAFRSVDSREHGGHGLIHRMAWATRYIDCKFQYNGGLGVFLNSIATPVMDAGTANGVTFLNCEARWNGGTSTTTTYADDKGGVRISGAAMVAWIGGVIESNNAWGVLVTPPSDGIATRNIHFKNIYCEDNPHSATVGGNFYSSGIWEHFTVEQSWLGYGAGVGRTGYNFWITGGLHAHTKFIERDNTYYFLGGGTGIIYHPDSRSNITAPINISAIFGDTAPIGAVTTTTMFAVSEDGKWIISGILHIKRNSDTTGATLPFTVAYDPVVVGRQFSIGASINGSTAPAPTLLFDGVNFNITLPAYCCAYVEVNDGGIVVPPTTLIYNSAVFGEQGMRRQ